MNNKDIKLTNYSLYGYGIGNLGYGMILQAMTTYLLFFGTSILKLSGSILGIIIGISVFWDAISDPIMGSISDFTYNKRFGRRHLYILIGCIGIGVFNAILWSINVDWPDTVKLILITIMIFGVKTLSTVFVTPYLALSGELTEDYYERTKIQSVRTVFFVMGLGFTVVVGMTYFLRSTDAYPVGQLNGNGYMYLGFTTSIIMLIVGIITYMTTKSFIPYLNEKVTRRRQKRKLGVLGQLRVDFKAMFDNSNYLYVALAYLSANLSSAIIGSIGLHVFTYTFRLDSSDIGIILGGFFVFMILSQPFWLKYSRKYDKKQAAILATLIGIGAGFVFLINLIFKSFTVDYPYSLMIFFMLAGVGVGGLLTLPLSMVGDTIDVEEYNTGKRSEGLYYGGLTFSYKASQAVAIFLIGVLLDTIGFNPELNMQTAATEMWLGLIMAIGCLVAFGLTLMAYSRYNLSHEEIQRLKKLKETKHDTQTEQ